MAEPRTKPSYVQVNRNFCNFPLARDGRVRAEWRRSKKTGRMWCEVPGERRIRLRLDADADVDLRRLPTGFDVLVLLTLIRDAYVQGENVVEYASVAAVIRDMGLEPEQSRRQAVTASLDLWSALSIVHSAWYSDGISGQRLVLPPPISRVHRSPGRLRIRLSPEWFDLGAKYYVRVPTKLPTRAPLQNLILWLLTAPNNDPDPKIGGGRLTQHKTRRQLCRTIGVNHGTRNEVLASTIDAATSWFEQQGGRLECMSVGGLMVFIIDDPKHRGRKKSQPRVRSTRVIDGTPRNEPRPAPVRPAKPVPIPATDDFGNRYMMYRLPDGTLVDKLPSGP